MPLPWVRLDTSFPSNPKVLALLAGCDATCDDAVTPNRRRTSHDHEKCDGYRSAFVYLCGLAYVGSHGTDGFIPREALPFVHGGTADAERLVLHGLWVPQPGGWLVNGWSEFQESNEETARRRIRAQAGAAARWNGHEASSGAERTRRWRERKDSEGGV